MNITMQDIADRAGVSRPVVSAVLNGKESFRVALETREKILKIARDLSYCRNALAASTRTGIVKTIAVITDFSDKRPEIIAGIMEEGAKYDYNIKIFSDADLDLTVKKIMENRIGLIISLSAEEAKQQYLKTLCQKHGLKVIFHFAFGNMGFPCINIDFRAGGFLSVKKLIALGHKRIGLICGPLDFRHYHGEYRQGYLEGLARGGVPFDEELCQCRKDFRISVENLLSLPPGKRPTALICISDVIAYYTFRTAARKGLLLPEELSIIGFGNFTYSDLAFVPLTSLDEFLPERGRLSVELLLGKKRKLCNKKDLLLLKPELVIRESTTKYNQQMGGKK